MQCTVKCWNKIRSRRIKPVFVTTKRLLVVTDNISTDVTRTKAVSVQNSVYFNNVFF